ncbi:hypothetical protein MYA98_12330 [Salmonella sp. WGH-01]|nr:hypothetical protein MYA98_12330 [Salmonella sp. WGH-01]
MDVLPGTLTNPGLTALWEQMLDEVAAGRVSWMTLWQSKVSGSVSWSLREITATDYAGATFTTLSCMWRQDVAAQWKEWLVLGLPEISGVQRYREQW